MRILLTTLSIACLLPACSNPDKTNQSPDKQEATLKKVNEKPNVLFIAVDDLKPLLTCYGTPGVHTPNIDRLAARGAVFMNNHCQVPVSGASRASLLTGMYPDQNNVWAFDTIRKHNPDVITLPQHFKNNGYTTINLGKIFDYRTVDKYSDSVSWSSVFPVTEEDYYPHYNKKTGIAATYHYQSPYVKKKYQAYKQEAIKQNIDTFRYAFKRLSPAYECIDVPDDAYKDGIFAKLAIREINKQAKQNAPFFLAVGFHKPHLPFVAPKKYWDMYDPKHIALAQFQKHAQNAVDYAYHNSSELRKYTNPTGQFIYAGLEHGNNLSDAEQRKLIHAYLAAVSFVDAQVGKLLKALEDNGLADNTIIVFWGDHGWHLGDHGMWGKATTFEQATRSPLIIATPGMKPTQLAVPTEFIDIYPTLCELAALEKPPHLAGESLVDMMQGKIPEEAAAFTQWGAGQKMGYAIRTGRYRYVEWHESGRHVNPQAGFDHVLDRQLFDYQKDPQERVNYADDPEYADIQSDLARKLKAFYR